MNTFTFVKQADSSTRVQILEWNIKIQQYLENYYNNQIERATGTEFGDCMSKVAYLAEGVIVEPESFRGVKDASGRLQAGALVEEYFDCLYIDTLTNAPWNVIKNQPETVKGAATSLIEQLVLESIELEYNGRLRAISIERAKPFYLKIGFIEEEDAPMSLELTPTQAGSFLAQQNLRRQS